MLCLLAEMFIFQQSFKLDVGPIYKLKYLFVLFSFIKKILNVPQSTVQVDQVRSLASACGNQQIE